MTPNEGEIVALRAIVEGTARATGDDFFASLVGHLAAAVQVDYAFIAEFAGSPTRVRTLAYWGPGGLLPSIEFDLDGTPCEEVVRGNFCHHPGGVRESFPLDRDLIDLGIESYLGVPLLDGDGNVLGHMAVFDGRPMPRLRDCYPSSGFSPLARRPNWSDSGSSGDFWRASVAIGISTKKHPPLMYRSVGTSLCSMQTAARHSSSGATPRS